jgi:hypothetical protein
MSVPEAVRQVLANNNVYLQAIEHGIANYTALAEKIKPEIDEKIRGKANPNTIVVAIKRYADTVKKQDRPLPQAMATRAKMSLTSSIIDIDFQKEYDDAVAHILEEFFGQEGGYSLFQSDNHFSLLADNSEASRNLVASRIEELNGKIEEGLSKITIAVSPDEQDPYYMLSLVSSLLYNHRISIHSAFFTSREIVLVLADRDAARAYDLIRTKIG